MLDFVDPIDLAPGKVVSFDPIDLNFARAKAVEFVDPIDLTLDPVEIAEFVDPIDLILDPMAW